MSLGENKLHPLQIEDARDAAYEASKLQRQVEEEIRQKSRALANAERKYREALAQKILALRAQEDKPAWSVCDDLARGDSHVARLRFERDVAEGILDASRQQAFRRGADRKDVQALLRWSQAVQLRTDVPPADYDRPSLEPVA